jgi:hypothetical protein
MSEKRKEKNRREKKRKDRRKTIEIKAFKTETTNSVTDQRSLNAVEQLNVKTILFIFFADPHFDEKATAYETTQKANCSALSIKIVFDLLCGNS